MKIASIETTRLSIPFTDGGSGEGMTPSAWNKLDFVLVRIETETGLVGWGEAFGYFCEGFRMPALRDVAAGAGGRRPKASREGTRGSWA